MKVVIKRSPHSSRSNVQRKTQRMLADCLRLGAEFFGLDGGKHE